VTVLAVGTGNAILAWIVIVVALLGALAAVALLTRVVQPALEIERYAAHIRDAGEAIASNLEGTEELERTRELARAVPGLAATYLEKAGGR
jgi:hypothetical protein